MRVLRSAVRLFLTLLALLTMSAILLGRYGPKPSERRQAGAPRYQALTASPLSKGASEFRIQNVKTGVVERIQLDEADRVDYASCSPWQDSQGRSHVTGLWKSFEGSQVRKMGLARIAIPGGEILDRVALNAVPASSPCWYPGTSASVLFSGWDGQLYSYSFDDPPTGAEESSDSVASRPTPLAWRNPPPWDNHRQFWEPTWPTDPRLGKRLIVSVSFRELGQDQEGRTRTQLWWLKLTSDRAEIEDLGPLITPGPTDAIAEERLANIAATPDGGLVLAYLARQEGDPKLHLRLGSVKIDATTGHPSVDAADVVELPGPRLANQPRFSADGGWIDSVSSDAKPNDAAERFSVIAALAARPKSETKPAPLFAALSVASTARTIRNLILLRLAPLRFNPSRLKQTRHAWERTDTRQGSRLVRLRFRMRQFDRDDQAGVCVPRHDLASMKVDRTLGDRQP
ncbi:hypothetical protein SAMN05444166_0255 [Singulisphaera sp. GP187]|nr:hypothetical protein SAMN05444166_0255 [Singulisphaera sp. GP187]